MKSGRSLSFTTGEPRTFHEVVDAATALYGLRCQDDTHIIELTDDQGNTTFFS